MSSVGSVGSFGDFAGGRIGIIKSSFGVCSRDGSMVGPFGSPSYESSGSIGNLFSNRFDTNDGMVSWRTHNINDLSDCYGNQDKLVR